MPSNYPRASANTQGTPVVFTINLEEADEAAFVAYAKARAARNGVRIEFTTVATDNTSTLEVFGYGFNILTFSEELKEYLVEKGLTYDHDANGGTANVAAAFASSVTLSGGRFS